MAEQQPLVLYGTYWLVLLHSRQFKACHSITVSNYPSVGLPLSYYDVALLEQLLRKHLRMQLAKKVPLVRTISTALCTA
jgi:hypothetical protein